MDVNAARLSVCVCMCVCVGVCVHAFMPWGKHHWVPRSRRLFGGQIVGQALVAAAKSVSDELYAHSLHCYFVRAGDPNVPVLYQVERIRDGRSFCVRSVKAVQRGQPILVCQASFHKLQPSPLEHQFTMPSVPPPDALLTVEELIQQYLSDPNLADNFRQGLNKILAEEVPIEVKPVNPPDFYRRLPMEPKKLFLGPIKRTYREEGEADMKRHCTALCRCLCVRLLIPGHHNAAISPIQIADIQRFFSGYGKLLEIDLKNGYGFVEFEDTRDADDAVYELNGKELCGERVVVEHARGPRRDRDGHGGGSWGSGRSSSGYSSRSRSGRDKYGPPVRTEYRLVVENLSSRCSWQDLKDFMRQAGEVTYADAHKERTNEGVIEFRTYSDMKRALDKLDGTDINGRKIRLVEDKPKRRRSYSGSRSRSRSRRRSRSRSRRSRSSRSRSRSGSRSRSRSKRRSHSRSKRKSRSKSPAKSRSKKSRSRSRSRKSHSRSVSRKSRSKSHSKPRSERGSRSRSKEKSVSKKSRSRSPSPMENGDKKSVSRSPSPHDDRHRSKSPSKRSQSRSPSFPKSRSRSRSASQTEAQ
ncbi:Serine/arginine-rich splicing factor 4 [Bagarius yarrelli]|uniref:Serine/arginine-rich splicing factor 4 n=1 Tax=Bagarius yarrelli TaxID=175774 RepID=A0A556V956_BAGYA|nr:Serine/arginine-rich splicing factor 4 [Bagarius yarrelli]